MSDEKDDFIPTSTAIKLLLLDDASQLEEMVRNHWFKPAGRDRWRAMDLIHGFIQGTRNATRKAPAAAAAAHLCMSATRFKELIHLGIIKRAAAYDLDEVRRAYIEHLRRVASHKGPDDADLTKQRMRLAKQKADAEELKNKIFLGDYIDLEIVGEALEGRYAAVKERVLAIPAMAARLVSLDRAEIETTLRTACIECLEELYAPARLLEEAAQVQ